MKCDNPISITLTKEKSEKHGINTVPVPCGRCLPCKNKRVAQWTIRLKKELEVSTSAYFITLTYDTLHVPIIQGSKPMTLLKNSQQSGTIIGEKELDRSLQGFFKRLRYYESEKNAIFRPDSKDIEQKKSIKYYACGEYGSKGEKKKAGGRPHYHGILFNVSDYRSINKAWSTAVVKNGITVDYIPFGDVDIDPDVNEYNIRYVLKYINKENWNRFTPDDNRIKEFSLMSKGLGKNFINDSVESFYNRRLDINYVVDEGVKVAMPKYYRNKMFTEETKDDAVTIIKNNIEEEEKKREIKAKRMGINLDIQERNTKFVNQKLLNNSVKRKN